MKHDEIKGEINKLYNTFKGIEKIKLVLDETEGVEQALTEKRAQLSTLQANVSKAIEEKELIQSQLDLAHKSADDIVAAGRAKAENIIDAAQKKAAVEIEKIEVEKKHLEILQSEADVALSKRAAELKETIESLAAAKSELSGIEAKKKELLDKLK